MRATKAGAVVLLLALAGTAQAAVYTYNSGFANGGVIPDGNPVGMSDTRTISDWAANSHITDINVSINVSGGWNGDLYAYVSHGSTGFAVLLNRVGRTSSSSFGYGDAGFNITFADSAAH